MGQLFVEDKSVVVPGDVLAVGMDYLPAGGAFRDQDKVIASQVGVVNISERLVRVISLAGNYMPQRGDVVIGRVTDMTYSSWFVDVGYAYDAVLSIKEATSDFVERGAELTDYFNIGDFLVAKLVNVTKAKSMDLSLRGPGLRKIQGGKIISVTPAKIPRIVGKGGSMINMIKDATGCQVIAGQNGKIWISGKDPEMERKATDAFMLINEKAHVRGLTERIKAFLEGKGE